MKGLSLMNVGNGHWQVAFHKLPLYRFEGDKKKGQAHGQNVGNVWFAVLKSGIPASTAAPTAPTRRPAPTDVDHAAPALEHDDGNTDDADATDDAGLGVVEHTGTRRHADDACAAARLRPRRRPLSRSRRPPPRRRRPQWRRDCLLAVGPTGVRAAASAVRGTGGGQVAAMPTIGALRWRPPMEP